MKESEEVRSTDITDMGLVATLAASAGASEVQLTYYTILGRGKEMSLSRCLGPYYKLPKSDPNAVYLPPNAVYLLQCCFIAANIVWAGQCDNSLFPWKLYKINLTAQQTINTAIKN